MTKNRDLLPCPFCGGGAWAEHEHVRERMAHCSECGATVHFIMWNERKALLPSEYERGIEDAAKECDAAIALLDPKKGEQNRVQWNLACALRDNIRALKVPPAVERLEQEGLGVPASPSLSHPFGAEPVPVSGKAGIANAEAGDGA